jgi:hypothetical protein
MKRIKQVVAIAASVMVFAACQDTNDNQDQDRIANENAEVKNTHYVDLNTGAPVDLYYDADSRTTYNRDNDRPVEFYINTNTGDTVYGKGRFVVNGYLIREDDGSFSFDDTKVKVDGDELKIKGEDFKLKIDGDEMKFKNGDYKEKRDGDEVKIKDGDKKIKKEKGEPTKVKED